MKNQGLVLLLVIAGAVAVYYGLSQKQSGQVEKVSSPTSEVTTVSPAASESVSGAATLKQIDLTVTSPVNGSAVRQSRVDVRGKTVARAEVFVNEAETVAEANGNFSVTITLEEGENYILVVATDEQGQVAEKELTITYQGTE